MDGRRDGAACLCLGELNPDLILSGFDLPGPVLGTEQAFTREDLVLGSSTAITCVLLQRLGNAMALASLIGADDYGRFCLGQLAAEGVDTARVRQAEDLATGVTISLTYPADRLLVTRLGSMAHVDGSLVDDVDFARIRHLHCGSFFLLDRLRPDLPRVFERARRAGATVSLDPGWDPSETWDRAALERVLPLVDVFLPNRDEAAAITGAADTDAALDALMRLGPARIALKRGAEGGSCVTERGILLQPGFDVPVVDATGAGDAFNAGFIHGMIRGWNDAESLRLAVACGALAVGAPGGTAGLKGFNEARTLIEDVGQALPGH